MCQMLHALIYIHDQKIIHRDIKPDNVLYDEAGNFYLADFGLSKDENWTHSTVGTREYAAPEVFETSMTQTTKMDIWSLGVLVLKALDIMPRFPYRNTNDMKRDQNGQQWYDCVVKHAKECMPEIVPMLRINSWRRYSAKRCLTYIFADESRVRTMPRPQPSRVQTAPSDPRNTQTRQAALEEAPSELRSVRTRQAAVEAALSKPRANQTRQATVEASASKLKATQIQRTAVNEAFHNLRAVKETPSRPRATQTQLAAVTGALVATSGTESTSTAKPTILVSKRGNSSLRLKEASTGTSQKLSRSQDGTEKQAAPQRERDEASQRREKRRQEPPAHQIQKSEQTEGELEYLANLQRTGEFRQRHIEEAYFARQAVAFPKLLRGPAQQLHSHRVALQRGLFQLGESLLGVLGDLQRRRPPQQQLGQAPQPQSRKNQSRQGRGLQLGSLVAALQKRALAQVQEVEKIKQHRVLAERSTWIGRCQGALQAYINRTEITSISLHRVLDETENALVLLEFERMSQQAQRHHREPRHPVPARESPSQQPVPNHESLQVQVARFRTPAPSARQRRPQRSARQDSGPASPQAQRRPNRGRERAHHIHDSPREGCCMIS